MADPLISDNTRLNVGVDGDKIRDIYKAGSVLSIGENYAMQK